VVEEGLLEVVAHRRVSILDPGKAEWVQLLSLIPRRVPDNLKALKFITFTISFTKIILSGG